MCSAAPYQLFSQRLKVSLASWLVGEAGPGQPARLQLVIVALLQLEWSPTQLAVEGWTNNSLAAAVSGLASAMAWVTPSCVSMLAAFALHPSFGMSIPLGVERALALFGAASQDDEAELPTSWHDKYDELLGAVAGLGQRAEAVGVLATLLRKRPQGGVTLACRGRLLEVLEASLQQARWESAGASQSGLWRACCRLSAALGAAGALWQRPSELLESAAGTPGVEERLLRQLVVEVACCDRGRRHEALILWTDMVCRLIEGPRLQGRALDVLRELGRSVVGSEHVRKTAEAIRKKTRMIPTEHPGAVGPAREGGAEGGAAAGPGGGGGVVQPAVQQLDVSDSDEPGYRLQAVLDAVSVLVRSGGGCILEVEELVEKKLLSDLRPHETSGQWRCAMTTTLGDRVMGSERAVAGAQRAALRLLLAYSTYKQGSDLAKKLDLLLHTYTTHQLSSLCDRLLGRGDEEDDSMTVTISEQGFYSSYLLEVLEALLSLAESDSSDAAAGVWRNRISLSLEKDGRYLKLAQVLMAQRRGSTLLRLLSLLANRSDAGAADRKEVVESFLQAHIDEAAIKGERGEELEAGGMMMEEEEASRGEAVDGANLKWVQMTVAAVLAQAESWEGIDAREEAAAVECLESLRALHVCDGEWVDEVMAAMPTARAKQASAMLGQGLAALQLSHTSN